MAVIESTVHAHFANASSLPPTTDTTTNPSSTSSIPSRPIQTILEPPFAKVNSVSENSPAATAGLKAGDQIRNFGYVNHENHNGLRRVAECVQGNEGHEVLVKISRPGLAGARQELSLRLVPKKWEGTGLLGCHVLPL